MSAADLPAAGNSSASADWLQQPERGSQWLLRGMSRVSLRIGRRASRPILHLITMYYFLFAPAPRRHSRNYLRRILQREPRARERYRHLLCFATTLHDRIYLVNGRLDDLRISLEGTQHLDEAIRRGAGALLMGAHLGSFEIISAVGRLRAGLTIAMAMYEDNARKVNASLAALNPAFRSQVVPLGRLDTMLRIRALLDQGVFVGLLADRTLGAEPTLAVSLLGATAALPTGPMRAAALLQRPVIFMAGLHRGGNRYHIVFEPLADFSQASRAQREPAIRAAILRYGQVLERHCRSDPYNWFNFFDLWRPATAPGTAASVR